VITGISHGRKWHSISHLDRASKVAKISCGDYAFILLIPQTVKMRHKLLVIPARVSLESVFPFGPGNVPTENLTNKSVCLILIASSCFSTAPHENLKTPPRILLPLLSRASTRLDRYFRKSGRVYTMSLSTGHELDLHFC
jgi:hypothetical protein